MKKLEITIEVIETKNLASIGTGLEAISASGTIDTGSGDDTVYACCCCCCC